jgi:DNA gyrase subunit A
MVTAKGLGLRYKESSIRPMGRSAGGVTGIRLRPGDLVAGMEVVEPDADLLVVTEFGFGKRTPLKEYNPKGRGSHGSATINQSVLDKIGQIAAARVVTLKDDLTLISSNGVVLRLKMEKVTQSGRSTRGTHIMNLEKGDRVASLARIRLANGESIENGSDSQSIPGPEPELEPEAEPDIEQDLDLEQGPEQDPDQELDTPQEAE